MLIPFDIISQCKPGSQGLNPWSLSGNTFIVVVSSLLFTVHHCYAPLLYYCLEHLTQFLILCHDFLTARKRTNKKLLFKICISSSPVLLDTCSCRVKHSVLSSCHIWPLCKNKQVFMFVLLRQGLVHHNACVVFWLHDGMCKHLRCHLRTVQTHLFTASVNNSVNIVIVL